MKIGNLEPEENVMAKSNPRPITTYLMSKTNINNDWMGELVMSFKKLKWGDDDELCVKIGSDAFIVIENVTRNPVVPSQPNPDLNS